MSIMPIIRGASYSVQENNINPPPEIMDAETYRKQLLENREKILNEWVDYNYNIVINGIYKDMPWFMKNGITKFNREYELEYCKNRDGYELLINKIKRTLTEKGYTKSLEVTAYPKSVKVATRDRYGQSYTIDMDMCKIEFEV